MKGDSAEKYCADSAREREGLTHEEWAKRFNKYLKKVTFLLQPDFVVMGGGISKKFEKYQEYLTVNTKVIPARTLNLAGIIGAAMYCKTKLCLYSLNREQLNLKLF